MHLIWGEGAEPARSHEMIYGVIDVFVTHRKSLIRFIHADKRRRGVCVWMGLMCLMYDACLPIMAL